MMTLKNCMMLAIVFALGIGGVKATNGQPSTEVVNQKAVIEVGMIAPNFTEKNLKGKDISLKSFKGKYVLIDFWASWCGPCRRENPAVVAAYNAFKDKNFTILGVSLDKDRAAWEKAVKDDGLVWEQVSDLKGWNAAPAALYGVRSIPSNFLVDPQGRIIAMNLRGEALAQKLSEVLGK